ncbi:RibD family protein [Nocardioides marmoribigeumensis]|uniref:5-amino-6-(5-phosphoribosylamino)uracil reductase n=1 Tax=Nocardioides marmoribigeumensis TaxID=433649 RepID=A0ABU2C0I9_9ACTN|nr:dihydrofolate reductase family protein [Nocardioides marmoribigeumensis]MDR7364176.1 5-amino-6-(5-phosphoribosylamino)uracil reductase [Nocardioides marmoribigeumensis]
MTRPYVLLSCSLSLDGYLDNASDRRLVLSNAADLGRVDRVRAGCDAIMVGAGTIRSDDPRLVVRSPDLRAERLARGLPETPAKVTLTDSGRLDPRASFFTTGATEKLVFAGTSAVPRVRTHLAGAAAVLDGGRRVSMGRVVATLHERGVRRLMVEGGGQVHTQLLTQGLADELQLVVAPLFVGDSRAPRFVSDGRFPWDEQHRAELADVRRIGDVVLLRYALSERFSDLEEPVRAG